MGTRSYRVAPGERAIARDHGRPIAVALIAIALTLTTLTAIEARRAWGRPFPSLLCDPYGVVSGLALPSWTVSDHVRPAFPDEVIAIDDEPLPRQPPAYGDLPSERLTRRLADRPRSDRPVRLTILHGSRPVEVVLPVRRFGFEELLYLFLTYLVVGCFVLWSGVLVLLLSGPRPGAVAYALVCLADFIFLTTLYDYHSTRGLLPLFALGWQGTAVGCVWLAYAFPAPPRRARRWLKGAAQLFTAQATAVAAMLIVSPALHRWPGQWIWLANLNCIGAMALLGVSVVVRISGSRGRDRAQLRSAAWGVALSPLVIASGMIIGGGTFYLALPLLIAAAPLSIGHALIRHNILATTALLTRRMLVIPIVFVAALGAMLSWRYARMAATSWLMPLLWALVWFVALGRVGMRLGDRLFFVTTRRFRPTIEQLSDEMASLNEAPAIRGAVERIVGRWLPVDDVALLDEEDLAGLTHLPVDCVARLRAGERVWTDESPWRRRLLVPVSSLGHLRGTLMVAPKYHGALYTAEELVLLETIANLAAVALRHADVLAELDRLRLLERDATRDEKRLALDLLSAEISHEIAYPLNFFRYLLKRESSISEEDFDVGRQEIERLERMLVTLRRLRPSPIALGPVAVNGTVQRALDLLREPIRVQHVSVSVELPPDLTVIADRDPLLQIFANLLRNAVQAAGAHGAVGVRALVLANQIVFEVWDSGPGIADELRDKIFAPWVTTKESGTGLGLAVTRRIVHSFGWTIGVLREHERTCFRVCAPAALARGEATALESP
jgi:signal transduction histidine kinase